MTITVNGDAVQVPDQATVHTLVAQLRLTSVPCAVEVNQKLIPKSKHDTVELHEGDTIEVVTLVGGG